MLSKQFAIFVTKKMTEEQEAMYRFIVGVDWQGYPHKSFEEAEATTLQALLDQEGIKTKLRKVLPRDSFRGPNPKDFKHSPEIGSGRTKFPKTIKEARYYFTSSNYDVQSSLRLDQKLLDQSWFPCLKCQGSRVDGFQGQCGFYECEDCEGSGDCSQNKFEIFFAKKLQEYKEAEVKLQAKIRRLEEIKQMLSDEDFDILARHYFRCCECGEAHT